MEIQQQKQTYKLLEISQLLCSHEGKVHEVWSWDKLYFKHLNLLDTAPEHQITLKLFIYFRSNSSPTLASILVWFSF